MNNPPAEVVHFGLTEQQMRAKYQSTGSFGGPRPLCGNGSFHCKVTDKAFEVTCTVCQDRLKGKPHYL